MNHETATGDEKLIGIVDRFLFQNEESGFSIAVVTVNNNLSTIVKGYLPNINAGQQITVTGTWIMHAKFGRQFDAKTCSASLPNSVVGLRKYLGSGMIKGIGPAYAEKIVDYFGIDTLEIIDKAPERLTEVPGIGTARLAGIIDAWKDQKEIAKIMVFLQDKGVSTAYATKIYKKYQQESIAKVTEDPYQLAEDIWGIGFKTADGIAQHLGFAPESEQRIKAGLLFVIGNEVSNGHLYIEIEKLKTKTIELLEIDADSTALTVKNSLHNLYNTDKVKLISHDNLHYLALTKYYYSERGVAHKLKELIAYPTPHVFDIDQVYQSLRVPRENEVALNDDQQRGIMACLQNKVTVITGGPGTGKTTLIKKLLRILDENELIYRLAAPTGRAAKRIIEGTGRHAVTIHRLLEFDFMNYNFTYNETNALKLDFLIIDEASMIDIFLAHAILKALPLRAHIIFIGDVDQLPSVGAGNFLNDLIASERGSCVRLTQIFRQAQDSLIIVNAHKINNGEFPTTELPNSKRDFFFIKEEEPENVASHLEKIIKTGLKKCNISVEDTVILAPMNRGVAGTLNLNHHLQHIINPAETEQKIVRMGITYKLGDRVMQIRNNYDKKVFNGDMGIIDDINPKDKSLQVRFGDAIVEYDAGDMDELVLSYAISIHKSQGSEFSCAIIPIFMQHFTLLQRNLLYTAVTRAKKLCILIGQPKAIFLAIKNNKGLERVTFLKEYLTTDLEAR